MADAAQSFGRRVATLGLSMKKNVALARKLGVLRIPDSVLIDIEDIDSLPPGRGLRDLHRLPGRADVGPGPPGVGRQPLAGDPGDRHRHPQLAPDPGQRDRGHQGHRRPDPLGAKVVHTGHVDVHATGHAKQEELKTILSVTRPDWMIPVHGEYRHLAAHADLARQMGVDPDHVLLCEDGDRIELGDKGIKRLDGVPAGYLYVDGTVGDVGDGVLRDRKVLAEEGVVVVIVTVDMKTGAIIPGPEIVTRGWVYAPEAEDLLDDAADAVRKGIKDAVKKEGNIDYENLQRHVRKAAGKFVSDKTKRRPMIVPVVMEA